MAEAGSDCSKSTSATHSNNRDISELNTDIGDMSLVEKKFPYALRVLAKEPEWW